MNKRIIDNQTNMPIRITVFIQAGGNSNELHGTVNLNLLAGEIQAITYGDLRNNALSGMKVSPLPSEPTDTYYCRVMQRGDYVDVWLNDSDTIDVNIDRLKKMESTRNI